MTFCLGVKVSDGLVGIADTRVTSGSECITARKVTVHESGGCPFFLMTSGLRSVRDKAITYFEEQLETQEAPYERLYHAVNAFAGQIRRVRDEDHSALATSNLDFNLHALVGGQMANDHEHKLYLLYPQGNWVEVGPGSPYCIIGESGYGKPILDRTLKFSDSMRHALKVGCLAFDSTRISAANVDFPIDVVVYDGRAKAIVQRRFEKQDLLDNSNWWQDQLRNLVRQLPSGWMDSILDEEGHALIESNTISIRTAQGS
jgi:putative proteasome-type protease